MLSKFQPRKAAVLVALSSAIALGGCWEKKAEQPQQQRAPQATPVEIVVIAPTNAAMHTELPGRATAYRVAEVRPQVGGIVQKRLFEEGAEVKQGQSLYQIDPAMYKASVMSANAALQQAKANLELRKSEAARSAELLKANAVSKQSDDAVQANYKVAKANVAAAQAQLETARINLRYTEVKSPISGKVSISEVTPGALVGAGQGQRLTVVQQLDPIYVDVTQSYEDLAKLRSMLKTGGIKAGSDEANVTVILDDGSSYEHKGKLTFKDALVNEATSTVRIRAVVPNPDQILMPGMYVRARLDDGIRENVILLDQRATMRRTNGTPYVYVVTAENKIESRDIVISRAIGQNWLVESGLAAGDKVVVAGIQRIRPGAPVVPVPAGQGNPAAKK